MVPCGLQTTLDHIFWPSRVSRWPCGQRPHFKDPLPPQPARPLPLSQCGPLCPRDHIRPHFLALREGKSVAMWSETTFLSPQPPPPPSTCGLRPHFAPPPRQCGPMWSADHIFGPYPPGNVPVPKSGPFPPRQISFQSAP